MEEKRIVMIGVGVVLAVSTITILAVTMSSQPKDDEEKDERNKTNPFLLISLDGFRNDYIGRKLPTLESMAENGVRARYMMPSYPTVTFPNHYTIVTGLYPESHGIVANSFYDPDFDEHFYMGVKDGKWWGGEPIWNTLSRQNKTSATFFWPGSDIEIDGQHPTYWRLFDDEVPFKDRVDKVVEWLSMPEDDRPDWVSLYLEEPDHSGHGYGPNSEEVDNALSYVDTMLSRLLSGLRTKGMEDKVNIIVLADHGMAEAGPGRIINLADHVSDIDSSSANNTLGAFTMLRLLNPSEEAINQMVNQLSCPSGAPYMRAFKPQDLPTRFHYSNNRKIGDIVLDFDSGYFTMYKNASILEGQHGYDNHFSTMNALFIATGPDFKKKEILEPFQNIEIYNLMCYLTGVDPAPNNGTEGSLYAALLDPPLTPEVPMEDELAVAEYPTKLDDDTLQMANCDNDYSSIDDYTELGLNISNAEQEKLYTLHLPWGNPLSGNLSADVLLLYQKDHVTGYSQTLKMPLWVSFNVGEQLPNTQVNLSAWFSDVRLNPETTATCDSYGNLPEGQRDVVMFPLFPPAFSPSSLLPYLVSNAVPMYEGSRTMEHIARLWKPTRINSNPINMMMGPVFDKVADSLPDDFTNFDPQIPQVPSDIFIVITRCKQAVSSLHNCSHEDLDAFTFILPIPETINDNNNCWGEVNYETLLQSTVHDVELVTGLTFFSDMDPSIRLQLTLRIQTHMWRTTT